MVLLLGPFLLSLLLIAFGTRMIPMQPLRARRKKGESPEEAHLMLLGAYRVYSWLVWLVVATVIVGVATGQRADALPGWYRVLLSALSVALLVVSHALYWRLGYDRRRWVYVAGHLTGAFCLAEYLWALRRDVDSYLTEHETKKPGAA